MACSLFQETTGRNIQFIYLIENLLINIRNSVDWDLPVPVGLYVFVESDGNDGRVGCYARYWEDIAVVSDVLKIGCI